jgi:hypothetical protein
MARIEPIAVALLAGMFMFCCSLPLLLNVYSAIDQLRAFTVAIITGTSGQEKDRPSQSMLHPVAGI